MRAGIFGLGSMAGCRAKSFLNHENGNLDNLDVGKNLQ